MIEGKHFIAEAEMLREIQLWWQRSETRFNGQFQIKERGREWAVIPMQV
jgi:hypothetical protein